MYQLNKITETVAKIVALFALDFENNMTLTCRMN